MPCVMRCFDNQTDVRCFFLLFVRAFLIHIPLYTSLGTRQCYSVLLLFLYVLNFSPSRRFGSVSVKHYVLLGESYT